MMIRVIYQKARDAIRAAGDDLARARAILREQVRRSQALREELIEIGVESALTYALAADRKVAREGGAVSAIPPQETEAGEERHWRDEAHGVFAPSSAPASSGDGRHSPAEVQGSAATTPATSTEGPATALMRPMDLVPAPPSRASRAYRSVARMYSGMLGYRLHSAPNRVMGDATIDDLRREIQHVGRKVGAEWAYLHFLGEAAKRIGTKGTVGNALTAEEAQALYDEQRRAFGERITHYLAAGAE